MNSLLLLQFILLIGALVMDCTARDDLPLDSKNVDQASLDAPISHLASVDAGTAYARAADLTQMNTYQESSEPVENSGRISLQGCERIQLPGKGVNQAGEASWELLSSEGLAIYSRGVPVQGRIEITAIDAPACTVCIAPLSLWGFLAGDPGKRPPLRDRICTESLECNGTGDPLPAKKASLSFSMEEDRMAGKRSGLYAAYALDRNRSIIAPAQAFFLTEGDAVLQADDSYPSENSFIKINLGTGSEDNRKKLFAAAIMPRKVYDNATIRLVANGSKPRPVLALSSGSRFMEIEANPATARGQLMDMIALLPENSAIGVQESTQSAVDLILVEDGPWDKGEYVLNCAIYAPGAGLQGLKQKIIKIC